MLTQYGKDLPTADICWCRKELRSFQLAMIDDCMQRRRKVLEVGGGGGARPMMVRAKKNF